MKHPRLRRILKWGSLGILTLAVLLAVAVWFLLGTQGGTRWIFARLGTLIPGSIQVAELNGPLRGPLDIRGFVYERDGFEMHVDHLQLDWRLRELLSRQVDIQKLYADGIRIVPDPTPDETKQSGPLPDINLRFNIIVRDARVTNLAVGGAGEKPFVIDRIDLATTAIENNVRVDRLAVRAPLFDADVTGTVRPQGDYPVDLDLRWSARPPDMAAFSGSGKLAGTLEELRVTQSLRAPFPASAEAVLFQPLYKLRFDGKLRFSDFSPRLVKADLPEIPASGEVAIQGNLEEFTSQGNIEGNLASLNEQVGQVHARYQLAHDGQQWKIERADIALPGTPARLTAQGLVTLKGKEVDFQGDASWQNVAWPLRGGPPVVRSAKGSAKVEGGLEKYHATVQADIAGIAGGPGSQIPPGRWQITGDGTQKSFRFQSLQGDLLAGRITGQGEVGWEPTVRWNAKLQGRGINPGTLVKDFPGSLSFTAASQGTLQDAGPVGRVEISRLQGTLRGEPVSATASVGLAGANYDVSRLEARWSSAQLSASGRVGDRMDLAFKLNAPNLGIAVPQGAGSVAAEGRISGSMKAPRIAATVQGEGIRVGTTSVAEVLAKADVNLAPQGAIDLDVRSARIQSGENRIEELTVRGTGTRSNHQITASARNAEGQVDLALAGGLVTTTSWSGQVRRLDLRADRIGSWSLAGAAPLFASADAVQLRDFCWTSSGARLCATGGWSKAGPWSVDSTLADLPLSLLRPVLPPDLQITGDLDGTIQARGNGSSLISADIGIRPSAGEIRFPAEDGSTLAFRYEQGNIQAQASSGSTGQATAHLVLTDLGTVDARAVLPRMVPGISLTSQPLSGKVDVDIRDLGFLEGFVPDLDKLSGALAVNYALSGTVGSPRVNGVASLRNGKANVPRLGLELREIQLTATGDGSENLDVKASVRSGPGTLTMAGKVGVVPSAQTPVKLTIQGRRFEAMDTEEIKVHVSPDLAVSYQGRRIEVTGDVLVPDAKIEIEKRQPKGPVAASEDVVFVNAQNQPAPDKALALVARVRLTLGKDVSINVFGLKAKPTGSILALEDPGKATRGVGELELNEGTFKAYGQDLTIERGRLVFAGGPISNPGLDVRAYRKADDGTIAGIEARGTAEKPQVTLWSDPAMTQSEALAYLLLGHPLGEAQPQEGDRLANAATALGLKGGNLLAKKLAARYGLEEARIESGDTLKQASLVVGKYLSPKLYVAYGIGLFEPVNTFRIRYLLSNKFTLQAESGEGTSADLLYTVERGGKKPKKGTAGQGAAAPAAPVPAPAPAPGGRR